MGFFGALALVFIVLKLIGVTVVATWSWWWVLCPIWGPLAAWVSVVIVGLIIKWYARI